MSTPSPKIGSPEFAALKAEWDQKLADDGFVDIERPLPCRPNGDPGRHVAFNGDLIRPDNPAGRNVSFDVVRDTEEGTHTVPNGHRVGPPSFAP